MRQLMRLASRFLRRVLMAAGALRWWRARQWWTALALALVVGVVLGVATVLIPNDLFTRDIPPTPWSYPVWIATSALSGILGATYVRQGQYDRTTLAPTDAGGAPGEVAPSSAAAATAGQAKAERGSGWGLAGGLLAWFAIGCPVCNKIALLALGYSGAMAYFAPLQPWLATLALILTAGAVVARLSGQLACPVPVRRTPSERTPA